jgi:nicotinamide mononucleotide adenylyltransferase
MLARRAARVASHWSQMRQSRRALSGVDPRITRVAAAGELAEDVGHFVPWDKVALTRRRPELRPALLVSCGAFSPITLLHLRIFELARNVLEREQRHFEFLGGLVSPVSDAYDKPGLVAQRHRVAMCELGSRSSDWIGCCGWEAARSGWTRTVEVLEAYQRVVSAERGAAWALRGPVDVLLLCGADMLQHAASSPMWSAEDHEALFGRFGVVAVERAGQDSSQLVANSPPLRKFAHNIHLVPQTIANTISSTAVRAELAKGNSVRYLVPDAVADYIARHRLYLPAKAAGGPSSSSSSPPPRAAATQQSHSRL